jgi:hypothetical protein
MQHVAPSRRGCDKHDVAHVERNRNSIPSQSNGYLIAIDGPDDAAHLHDIAYKH